MPDLIDPFHRALYKVLTEKHDQRMFGLAEGSAVATQGSTVSTAEKYAAEVSYIEALRDVFGWCHEVEVEMYGKRAKPGED